jgi:hypothetical protein
MVVINFDEFLTGKYFHILHRLFMFM